MQSERTTQWKTQFQKPTKPAILARSARAGRSDSRQHLTATCALLSMRMENSRLTTRTPAIANGTALQHAAIADGMASSPISCPLREGNEQFLRGEPCRLDRHISARRRKEQQRKVRMVNTRQEGTPKIEKDPTIPSV